MPQIAQLAGLPTADLLMWEEVKFAGGVMVEELQLARPLAEQEIGHGDILVVQPRQVSGAALAGSACA